MTKPRKTRTGLHCAVGPALAAVEDRVQWAQRKAWPKKVKFEDAKVPRERALKATAPLDFSPTGCTAAMAASTGGIE